FDAPGWNPVERLLGRELDQRAAHTVVAVRDVDVAGAELVGPSRDRAGERRARGQRNHAYVLAGFEADANLERETGELLDPGVRVQGRRTLLSPSWPDFVRSTVGQASRPARLLLPPTSWLGVREPAPPAPAND